MGLLSRLFGFNSNPSSSSSDTSSHSGKQQTATVLVISNKCTNIKKELDALDSLYTSAMTFRRLALKSANVHSNNTGALTNSMELFNNYESKLISLEQDLAHLAKLVQMVKSELDNKKDKNIVHNAENLINRYNEFKKRNIFK